MELHTKNNVADMGTMLSNVCTVTILLTEDHSTLLCAATILNYGKKIVVINSIWHVWTAHSLKRLCVTAHFVHKNFSVSPQFES